jgi:hypothetical protein
MQLGGRSLAAFLGAMVRRRRAYSLSQTSQTATPPWCEHVPLRYQPREASGNDPGGDLALGHKLVPHQRIGGHRGGRDRASAEDLKPLLGGWSPHGPYQCPRTPMCRLQDGRVTLTSVEEPSTVASR